MFATCCSALARRLSARSMPRGWLKCTFRGNGMWLRIPCLGSAPSPRGGQLDTMSLISPFPFSDASL